MADPSTPFDSIDAPDSPAPPHADLARAAPRKEVSADENRPGFFRRLVSTFTGPRYDHDPYAKSGEIVGTGRDPDPLDLASGGGSFLRPWAKRDQALQGLSDGFNTLTDLMSSIRDNLETQQDKQNELLDHLKHLPETLKMIPEAQRGHTETLRTIHRQLEGQQGQQERLGDILEEIGKSGLAQKESIDDLQARMEKMRETDAQVSENLGGVGRAIGEFSRTSTASTAVLEKMQAAMDRRSDELEKVLAKQGSRFAWLMTAVVVIALLALAAAGFAAYLVASGKHLAL